MSMIPTGPALMNPPADPGDRAGVESIQAFAEARGEFRPVGGWPS